MAVLTVAADGAALTALTADRLTALIGEAIAARGLAFVSLTGGSTPKVLYEALADPAQPWRSAIDWSRVVLCWGDERHVPPDHADSNFGMANRALVSQVPIPPQQVHRMRGEIADARAAAAEYDAELRAAFAAAGRQDVIFDVMLLGLGDDAHIASIFPGSELLERRDRTAAHVAGVWAPHLDAWRITLVPAVILASRTIVMLVSGEKKAAAVQAALEAPGDRSRYPAQMLRDAGDRVEWFIDRPAARSLAAPPA